MKKGIWRNKFIVWKAAIIKNPFTWWNGICARSKLSQIGSKIFSMPSTLQLDSNNCTQLLKEKQIHKLKFVSYNLDLKKR